MSKRRPRGRPKKRQAEAPGGKKTGATTPTDKSSVPPPAPPAAVSTAKRDAPAPPVAPAQTAVAAVTESAGAPHHGPPGRTRSAALMLGALGVVYGDIGTSPLYALRECFGGSPGLQPTHDNVLGVLSLITWALILVITVKYIAFVMRADNRGEGGILALSSLAASGPSGAALSREKIIILGLLGTTLLYGEGAITPAVSVLSAVEGLDVVSPALERYVVPLSALILIALFSVQSRGTGLMGKLFGPVMLLWFVVIAGLGVAEIMRYPAVLNAIGPWHAVSFFARNGVIGVLVLASVFLVVTGGEALYADMGHFGKVAIRRSWLIIVLPALLLNYYGQGGLLLTTPGAHENPFYLLSPDWMRVPLIFLATAAAVIASQALITGAFSLAMQGVQLGYVPRLRIEHTSSSIFGQVYVPVVNLALMLTCLALLFGFRSSSALAGAYGIAASSTMLLTTVLLFVVARRVWNWRLAWALPLTAAFLVIDVSFWGANLSKVLHGGWAPILIASGLFLVMSTWRTGRNLVKRVSEGGTLPVEDFLRSLKKHEIGRVPGTAVFMYGGQGTPPALLHSLKHYRVLHDRNAILCVETAEVPYISDDKRTTITPLGDGFYSVIIRSGFMETVDVPSALQKARTPELRFAPMDTSFFLRHETLIARGRLMPRWRGKIFSWMMRNARSAAMFFHLPSNRVVELGAHLEM